MNEDPRCCGSGTCIIDIENRCWCGRQWDALTTGQAPVVSVPAGARDPAAEAPRSPTGGAHDL